MDPGHEARDDNLRLPAHDEGAGFAQDVGAGAEGMQGGDRIGFQLSQLAPWRRTLP